MLNALTRYLIVVAVAAAAMDNLFTTHPSTQNRIAALQRLASQLGGSAAPAPSSAPRGGPWGGAARSRGPWG